jgi:hypothetical protein
MQRGLRLFPGRFIYDRRHRSRDEFPRFFGALSKLMKTLVRRADDHVAHPRRAPHRNRPHATMLSDEIHNAPPPVALLDMPESERRHLRPPESAAEEDRQDGAVAQALRGRRVRRIHQCLCLLDREPIPQPEALGSHAPLRA